MFCAIAAGEAPAIRIYEDDNCLAILDIRPFTRGHTLVLPKKHTVDLTDTPRKPWLRWPPSDSGSQRRPGHRAGRCNQYRHQ
ncbi:HIT family protein [Mycobacterium ulcerans str. Harvey]|uniref:HIT family protein n=1 Tax=Mycobacterium ulcerans str. Harvey TaxID=1299332 RepID=A0ABP3A442_MYCUL|nr:HIT family protein [Mycobacterium ulcerans str. Harvey]